MTPPLHDSIRIFPSLSTDVLLSSPPELYRSGPHPSIAIFSTSILPSYQNVCQPAKTPASLLLWSVRVVVHLFGSGGFPSFPPVDHVGVIERGLP